MAFEGAGPSARVSVGSSSPAASGIQWRGRSNGTCGTATGRRSRGRWTADQSTGVPLLHSPPIARYGASASSSSPAACHLRPERARPAIAVRTRLGPTSTTDSTPSAASVSSARPNRTGSRRWRAQWSASVTSSPATSPLRSDTSGSAGRDNGTDATAVRNGSTTESSKGEWNACSTSRRRTATPSRSISRSNSTTTSSAPDTTASR